MPQDVTFSDLDASSIDEYAELLSTMLQEAAPDLNVGRGTMIWELIVRMAATAYVYNLVPIDIVRDYWNVAAVVADPAGADDTIVDLLMSNFNTTRSAGTKAVGQVEIILTDAHAMTVTEGTSFYDGTVQFKNAADQVVVVAVADKTSDSDRVLVNRGDGTYSFKVDVAAEVEGTDGNITYGTTLTVSPQPTYLSTARAAADFSGGAEPDTNSSLVTRLQQGLTAAILSSPEGVNSLLTSLIPSTVASSVIGMQSPELTRDQRASLGVSSGGRADILLRTQATIETAVVEDVTGTLTDASLKTYSLSLDRDDLAGAYKLVSVIPEGGETALPIITQTWGYDVSNLDFAPDIESAAEAAFSSYQTLDVTFTDVNDVGTYEVRFQRLPSIGTAQTYCMSDSYRDPLADWLVRSPVPAITEVYLTIKAPSGVTVDEDEVASTAAAAVNSHSFVEELSASMIVDAVQDVLPVGAYIRMPIGMMTTLIYPDRTETKVRSGNTIEVPSDSADGVSKNTVAFFASADTVDVTTEVIS